MTLKFTVLSLMVVTAIAHAQTSYAEACYDVSGSIKTKNISPTAQVGEIDLTLQNDSGVFFSESGSLDGKVTSSSAELGTTILDHKVKFPKGNHFKTKGDLAKITGISGAEQDGTPCAFFVSEAISDIPKGTKMFKNVTSVNVTANGVLNNCSYLNENVLTLSGKICLK